MLLAPIFLMMVSSGSWVSSAFAVDEFFEKYTYAKTMSECFGGSAYEEYLLRIAEARRDCDYSSHTGYDSTRPPNYNPSYTTRPPRYNPSYTTRPTPYNPSYNSRYPDPYTSTSRPFFTVVTSPPMRVNPGRFHPSSNPNYGPQHVFFTGTARDESGFGVNFLNKQSRRRLSQREDDRRRRVSQTKLYDSMAINMALDEISYALRNFTCVLGRLQLIDSHLNIDYQMIVNNYYNSPIDNQLREDLIAGISYCKNLVTCMPEDKSPITYELQRLMAFMRCEKKTRLSACFKQDLRRNLHQFDVSALPDDGNRSSDIEKLMTVLIGSHSLDQLELY